MSEMTVVAAGLFALFLLIRIVSLLHDIRHALVTLLSITNMRSR